MPQLGIIPALFARSQAGCIEASALLYDLSFQRLRRMARQLMSRESPGHTLPPTALVSELFLKLRSYRQPLNSDDHFFLIAARAMRQVLVDHSRVRGKKKRLTTHELLDSIPAAFEPARQTESFLAIRSLMEQLEELDPRAVEAMRLRYLEGRTFEDIARTQRREVWRIRADIRFGLQWLADRYGVEPIK